MDKPSFLSFVRTSTLNEVLKSDTNEYGGRIYKIMYPVAKCCAHGKKYSRVWYVERFS